MDGCAADGKCGKGNRRSEDKMGRDRIPAGLASLAIALMACGGINGDGSGLMSTQSAAADLTLCANNSDSSAGAIVYRTVNDQCLKSFSGMGISRRAGESLKRALAAPPSKTVDAIALLDWAETAYPQYFPSHQSDKVASPYIYRYYPETQNHLGVAGDKIFVLGPVSAGALLYIGTLSEFSCRVYPGNCVANVEVQPTSVMVTRNGTRQFSATVTGTEGMAVTWSLSGAGCAGAACGTISSSGLYRAPASAPVPARITVEATLASEPSKSGIATVDVMATDNAKLKGEFAFRYQGYWNGRQGQCVGKFTADGAGNLTGGAADCTSPNYPGGTVLNLPFVGSYSVFEDNRGEMVWALSSGGLVTFRFALTASGDEGLLQSFYSPSVIHAGRFRKQDAAAFSVPALNGDYVFQLAGAGDLERGAASIGRFRANGAGQITSGSIDINDGAIVHQYLSLTGSYTVGQNGRGTAQFAVAARGTLHFVLHVVSKDRLILSSIDPPVPGVLTLTGEALAQTGGPFSNESLRATGVFHLSGRMSAFAPTVAVGLLTSDGVGGVSGVLDQNRSGSITANQPFAANYTITADGRGTIGAATDPAFLFHVVRPNHVLLMSLQPLGSPVLAGALEPQRPGPFTSTSLLGQYATATVAPPIATSVTVTATTLIDPTGLITVPQDWTSPIGLTANATGQGAFTISSNGRAVVTPAAGGSAVLYVISPMRFVEIMTSVPATPQEDKTLLFFGEQ
jgi:hypothetical protein